MDPGFSPSISNGHAFDPYPRIIHHSGQWARLPQSTQMGTIQTGSFAATVITACTTEGKTTFVKVHQDVGERSVSPNNSRTARTIVFHSGNN